MEGGGRKEGVRRGRVRGRGEGKGRREEEKAAVCS